VIFTEFSFFVFFAFVFCIHWLIKSNKNQKLFLILVSYVFYSAWDWRFLSLVIFTTMVDYTVGVKIHNENSVKKRKTLLLISLAVNLGVLFFFKYCNFFIDSAVIFLAELGIKSNIHTLNIILPIGISFYTFQSLSYTIDVYRKKIDSCKSKLDFALFVAFFPQLVAGPIARAAHFIPQLKDAPNIRKINFRFAFWLFTFGFIKKSCIADNIAVYVDAFYRAPASFDTVSTWIASVLYAIQIYCDFSGYTDMAIACAAMLGYKLCNNFSHPYFSTNITEFWRRWHISLSSWLRDYLYISLGGNRVSKLRTDINLMTTMLLGGLWHGASWNFVIWGGLHGLALICNKYWMLLSPRHNAPSMWRVIASVLVTFIFVNFCWVLFRANNLSDGLTALSQMMFLGSSGIQVLPYSLIAIIAACGFAHFIEYRYHLTLRCSEISPVSGMILLGITWAVIMLFIPVATTPFIYFQF